MAGKEPSGVRNFVHNRDANSQGARAIDAPEKKRSHDDLKLPTGKHSAANTGQTRSTAQTQSKKVQAQSEPRGSRRDSTGDRPFYGTDASISDSSLASSARNMKAEVTGAGKSRHTNGPTRGVDAQAPLAGGEHDSSSEEFEDDSSNLWNGFELEGPGGALSSRAQRLMNQHEKPDQVTLTQRGAELRHLDGIDSYPPTTSGNPSVDKLNDSKNTGKKSRAQTQPRTRSQQAPTTAAQTPALDAQDQRERHQGRGDADRGQSRFQGSILVDPRKDDRPVEQQLNEEFSFTKANKPTVPLFQQQQRRTQPSPGATDSRQHASNNTADWATTASSHNNTNVPRTQADKHVENVHDQTSRQRQRTAFRPQKKPQARIQAEQRAIDEDQDSNHSLENDDGAQGNMPTSTVVQHDPNERHEPDPMNLDYEREELFNMEYAKVKAQSFDIDPNAKRFDFPDADSITDLSSKMDAAAELFPQHQSHFFASLSIDEWEQAGDWFITRFSEVLNKLKTNRKDTREAAKAFENEIEKRYGAVSKKRKQIDDELNEMKESGGKVLQGTPKKAKMK